jgi:hypothetical protein
MVWNREIPLLAINSTLLHFVIDDRKREDKIALLALLIACGQ